MGHVGLMHALVADLAVAEIPEPVPVVVHQVAIERPQLGRPDPVVEVEGGGGRLVGLEADAPPRLADVGLAHQQFAPLARLQGGHFTGPAALAALLGAVLDDDAVFFRGLDALAAFEEGMAAGLFHVDVLAGLAAPDRQQRVPMVGAGDGNGIQILVFQGLAEVLHAGGLVAGTFLDALGNGAEERTVGIDQVGDFHPLHAGILADMRPAPAVDPGHRHTDLVVGPEHSGGRFGSGDHEVGMDAAGGGCSSPAAASWTKRRRVSRDMAKIPYKGQDGS